MGLFTTDVTALLKTVAVDLLKKSDIHHKQMVKKCKELLSFTNYSSLDVVSVAT